MEKVEKETWQYYRKRKMIVVMEGSHGIPQITSGPIGLKWQQADTLGDSKFSITSLKVLKTMHSKFYFCTLQDAKPSNLNFI